MFLISTGCSIAVDRCTELQHATNLHIFFSLGTNKKFTGYHAASVFLVSAADLNSFSEPGCTVASQLLKFNVVVLKF